MARVLYCTGMLLLVLQAGHSYILLTANIDDLKNIGKRVVQSPIAGQVGHIVRRAYDVFNNNLGQARVNMRADDDDIVLAYQPEDSPASRRQGAADDGASNDRRGSKEGEPTETFSALGKSASVYLQKIKKIFENA